MSIRIPVNIDTVEYSVEGMKFDLPDVTKVQVINPAGDVKNEYQNRKTIWGKHEIYSLKLRTFDSGEKLCVEGSLGGFLYGQNVFTTHEMSTVCLESLKKICEEFYFVPPDAKRRWKDGDIDLDRVDLACNFRLGSEAEVISTLMQIKRQLAERNCGVQLYDTTAYLSPDGGSEYSIGFYAKGPEMRRLTKFDESPHKPQLLKECRNILRIEIRLRAALKKLGLNKVSAWTENTAEEVFRSYMRKLDLLNVTTGPVTEAELQALPSRLRPVLAMHKAGLDLTKYFSLRTLQRHRRDFHKQGIDLRCPNQPIENVVPLLEVLTPERVIATPPTWLKEAGLFPELDKQARKNTVNKEASVFEKPPYRSSNLWRKSD